MVKVFPVAKALPPVEEPNQDNVPELAVAVRVTDPVPHRLAGVVLVIVGAEFTVAITATLSEIQSPLFDST